MAAQHAQQRRTSRRSSCMFAAASSASTVSCTAPRPAAMMRAMNCWTSRFERPELAGGTAAPPACHRAALRSDCICVRVSWEVASSRHSTGSGSTRQKRPRSCRSAACTAARASCTSPIPTRTHPAHPGEPASRMLCAAAAREARRACCDSPGVEAEASDAVSEGGAVLPCVGRGGAEAGGGCARAAFVGGGSSTATAQAAEALPRLSCDAAVACTVPADRN